MNFLDALDETLLRDNTVLLNGDIDEVVSGRITRSLQILDAHSTPDNVTLLLSSRGGAVDSGNAIINAMQNARAKGYTITGEVRGYAMSMAAVILQHADIRIASEYDIIMVHGPQSITVGDVRNQEADLNLTRKYIEDWAKFFAERNTSTRTDFTDARYWLSLFKDQIPHYFVGKEALEAGLVDIIL